MSEGKSALSKMVYHVCVAGTLGYFPWLDFHLSESAGLGQLRPEGLMIF